MPSSLASAALLALATLAPGCRDDAPPTYTVPAFATDPTPPGPLGGLIVTSNNGDDTLSAVDPGGPRLRFTVPLGFIPVELEGPHHVSASPDGRFLYVNLSEAVVGSGGGPHGAHGLGTIPGYALQIDTGNGRLVGQARVDPNPGDNAISPDGSTLYVTHYDLLAWTRGAQSGDLRKGDSPLAIINTAAMTLTKKIPLCPSAHGVRLSASGKTLYATCGPDEIAVADVTDPAAPTATRVLLPGAQERATCDRCPYALSVAPDDTVWVFGLGPSSGTQGRGSLSIYDPARQPEPGFDPARTVDFCGSPVFGAFARTGPGPHDYLAYVPEQGRCGDWIRIFAPGGPGQAPVPAGEILFTRAQCQNAHMMLTSGDDKVGYLVCEGDHKGPSTLVVIDLAAKAATGYVPVGVFADGLVMVPRPKGS